MGISEEKNRRIGGRIAVGAFRKTCAAASRQAVRFEQNAPIVGGSPEAGLGFRSEFAPCDTLGEQRYGDTENGNQRSQAQRKAWPRDQKWVKPYRFLQSNKRDVRQRKGHEGREQLAWPGDIRELETRQQENRPVPQVPGIGQPAKVLKWTGFQQRDRTPAKS